MPYPEVQGARPSAIPNLESTTAMHSAAAGLTENTGRCGAWIITIPGCATRLPPVAACAQSSLDLRYPNCCKSATTTPMTLILWRKHTNPALCPLPNSRRYTMMDTPAGTVRIHAQAAQQIAVPRTSLALE